jgi:L-methionine (R)-S-oxide reductase
MFEVQTIATDDKTALYEQLLEQGRAVVAGESDRIANAANLSALLFHALPDVIWAGFYFLDGAELVVGPYQGKLACVRISLGRGVCGLAAERRKTVIVADVKDFDDHIVCDVESRSEIAIPIISDNGELAGVLDIDSASPDRFDQKDAQGLEAIARLLATR